MSHKFFLEFDRSWISRKGPNLIRTPGFGPKGKGSFDRRKCYSYVIKDRSKISPKSVQLVPVGYNQHSWLLGPATILSSRSIVYPCSRGKCSLPCPCLLCDKKHPTCRAGKSCDSQDCRSNFEDHSNFHACLHVGCRFCHSIITVMPVFNFFFLDKSKRICNKGVDWEEQIRPTFQLPTINKDLVKNFLAREKWPEKLENWNCDVEDDALWCKGCSTLFFDLDMLREHLLSKHSVSKVFYHNCSNDQTRPLPGFSCEHCSASFGTKLDLTRHIESVHFKEQFECEECSSTFSRQDKLKMHRKLKHGSAHLTLNCESCEEVFSSRTAWDWHARLFCNAGKVYVKTFKCEVCDKVFSSKSTLKRHTRELCNEDKKVYVLGCDHCDTTFVREHDLKRHKQRSLNEDGSSKFKCSLCDERACNGKLLMVHVKAKHGDTEVKQVSVVSKGNDRKDNYECEYCGKRFVREQDLLRHNVTHSVADKIKCEFCEATFSLEKNFKRHKKETYFGNGKLKHKCPICEKAFCTGRLLSGHMQRCQAEFVCQFCKQMFTFKQNLERHVRNRVAVTCEECGKPYCNEKAYYEHVKNHHKSLTE